MVVSDRDAARYNVRTLLPGPDSGLRAAVARIGAPTASLAHLARHAAVEAIAIDGLRLDETRVIERSVEQGGGTVLTSPAGDSVVVLTSLLSAGELPQRLREWGRATETVADAIAAALTSRMTNPLPLHAGAVTLEPGTRCLVIAATGSRDLGGEGGGEVCDDATREIVLHSAGATGLDELLPTLASTPGGLLLTPEGDTLAAICASARAGLAACEAAGMVRSRVWLRVVVGTAAGPVAGVLAQLGQLRCIGVAVVADLGDLSGGAAAASAVMARAAGAHVVICRDGDDVRDALAVADAVLAAG